MQQLVTSSLDAEIVFEMSLLVCEERAVFEGKEKGFREHIMRNT